MTEAETTLHSRRSQERRHSMVSHVISNHVDLKSCEPDTTHSRVCAKEASDPDFARDMIQIYGPFRTSNRPAINPLNSESLKNVQRSQKNRPYHTFLQRAAIALGFFSRC